MKKTIKQTGFVLAVTAAALFTNASFAEDPASAQQASVHCMGINSCKGKSECNTATNACAGQNSCKGKGWITVKSAEECVNKGGTVVK